MQSELAALIDRHAHAEGLNETRIPRLNLFKCSEPSEPVHAVYDPAFCMIAQGAKQTMLGDRLFRYDPDNYLIVSVDVPVAGQVIEASPDKPYLGVKFDLDREILASLLLDGEKAMRSQAPAPALSLSSVTPELTDALVRLLRLLDKPEEIPVLAPLAEKEILFRLLQGEQAAKMREIAFSDSRLSQVSRAILWIRSNFREALRVEELAAKAGMSPSALHSHFKAVTAMSPLQYQKQIRLQEARRLMLSEAKAAAVAAFEVGYESPSQFSREYARLFGTPPARDAARLRAAAPEPLAV